MGVLEKTERDPNYYNDIKTYGKCGEDDFISFFNNKISKKGYTLHDVRKIKEYQNIDIDFIIDKNGDVNFPTSLEQVLLDKRYIKIEVKYDSVALETGNIAYESISHGSLGWGDITKCDFIYQVFTEKNSLIIKKRAWIDMAKWKEYLSNRKNKKKINYIKNEEIIDLLCNLNDMEEKNVLTFIEN